MDRTGFFKACVKAIRTRSHGGKSNIPSKETSNMILGKTRSKLKTEFGSKACELVSVISFVKNIFYLVICRKKV